MSFAKDQDIAESNGLPQDQVVLREIQNRGSLGGDEIQQPDPKANLSDVIASRRDQKLSQKKSDLYLKIMKDHGLEGKITPKLNYDISSLVQKTPVTDLLQIVKSDSAE